MARILWKGLSATKQFTELFCLRLVFIRTTDKKLTGFDCKLFSCLLFVRQTLPRNRPRIAGFFKVTCKTVSYIHFDFNYIMNHIFERCTLGTRKYKLKFVKIFVISVKRTGCNAGIFYNAPQWCGFESFLRNSAFAAWKIELRVEFSDLFITANLRYNSVTFWI